MFVNTQNKSQQRYYAKMLKTIGSLSRLFSESPEPYIAYRVAENLFCKAFDAENLSRSDVSADATKDHTGIGIKTFLHGNGTTLQKVAEFNSEHALFDKLDPENKVLKIAEMRNERIEMTKRLHGLDDMMYHCVTRKENSILLFEEPMDLVQINKISHIQQKKTALKFRDGLHEYSFNIPKSTLLKRFVTQQPIIELPVQILTDPFAQLEQSFAKIKKELRFASVREDEHIFLPLYSTRGKEKNVPEKSGLNQWNAGGRARNANEVYIPIPAWIHKSFPRFFPPRDTHFTLLLPNGDEMEAKVCQDNSKALMSRHNADLGKWLLREVLALEEGELLTYEKLEELGVDTVVIYKMPDGRYDIDFTRIGSYERFEEQNKSA